MKALMLALAIGSAGQFADKPQTLSPRKVVQAKFEAVNRHSVDEVASFYAPDAELKASDFCTPRHGRADVQRTYEAIFKSVPDVVADVQEYVVEGERVAVRLVVRSRLPGRSFDLPIMNFFTVRDGMILSDEGIFDNRGRSCRP